MRSDRPKLGQNFLVDVDWQQRIVSSFSPTSAFGEIGPGHGELTQHLAKTYSNFVVFEKDRELVKIHRDLGKYEVIEGDFLDWDFSIGGFEVQDFSLIGNLPYESGTAIVKRIVERAPQVSGFVFMLQKEVVDRMTAKPKTRAFGSLTILVQGQFDLEVVGDVPPKAFNPAPKVMSSVFKGIRRKTGAHPRDSKYHRFLMGAFSMKRKTLKNVLKGQLSALELKALYSDFGWIDTIRAEELEVDLWPKIFEWITERRAKCQRI